MWSLIPGKKVFQSFPCGFGENLKKTMRKLKKFGRNNKNNIVMFYIKIGVFGVGETENEP